MFDPLMIYGATGYTGSLILNEALALGLRPVLGGRNQSRLAQLAERLGLVYQVASLGDPDRLDTALRKVRVVLNAAGPFSQTAWPMVEACLRTGTHYLDISAEAWVIEALALRNAEARSRQIMIMPAVGFDVVASDCLASHLAGRLRDIERLSLGIRGLRLSSRGSARTFVEYAGRHILIRRNGVLTAVAPGSLRRTFDYGDGPRISVNVTWGDVAAAFYTTGAPNIEVYVEATPLFRNALNANRYLGWAMETPWVQAWLKLHTDLLPEGPTEEQRRTIEMVVVGEAENGDGRRVQSRLRTPQSYTFTGMTAPAIARRVLSGDVDVGFQTPGRVYGQDFVLSFPGVSREDLD